MSDDEINPSQIQIYILNEGKFISLDKRGILSYTQLGIEHLVQTFLEKRLKHFGFRNYSFINNLANVQKNNQKYSCVINIVNPFIDLELVMNMATLLKNNPEYEACECEGAVPGTEPDSVFFSNLISEKDLTKLKSIKYFHDAQAKYNNQLNLRKLKRIKIFTNLINFIGQAEILTIPELMEKLQKPEIFQKLVSYFEDVKLTYLGNCPACSSALQPIFANVSQPTMGYLPQDYPYHYQCLKCKLIVVSPYINAEDTEKLYDFYYSESQGTKYFLNRKSHLAHYNTALSMTKESLPKNCSVLDLGSGSGSFLYYVKEHCPTWKITGSDLLERNVHFQFNKDIEVLNLNFLKDDFGTNKYDLITSWEVIEHVPFDGFKTLLNKSFKALKPGGIFLFSTPDFDSPLCKAFDLYAVCPPQHDLVFSKSWMNNYFSQDKQFQVLGIANESELFGGYENWFTYWKNTSKYFEAKALAELFLELLKSEKEGQMFKEFIKKKEWGVEMIVALRKREEEIVNH